MASVDMCEHDWPGSGCPDCRKEFEAARNANRAWKKWRHRANKGIPALAARIFALRSEPYNGFGFHYGLERSLGNIIADLNDFETYRPERERLAHRLILQIRYEGLHADVVKAERSLRPAASGSDDQHAE